MKTFKNNCLIAFILPLLLLVGMPVQAKAPNIVFILADDLDKELFTHSLKINSLIAMHGIKFDNNFVSISLCCPSRATLLKGQYAHNTGIFTNSPPKGGFPIAYANGLEKSTVATWLQSAGYRTALLGKYLNGYPSINSGQNYVPPGWSYWLSPNSGQPYSEYNYSLNENGKTVNYGNTDADYLVDVLSKKAAKFIKNNTAHHPDKPFFLYIAPYIPHLPSTPPSRYANDFPGLKAPRSASFNEANIRDKIKWLQAKPLLTDAQIVNIDTLYRKRRQSMQAVEDLVENQINTLQALGELDNTYVIFSSDNGFHQGQHRLNSGKDTAFEEDIKVPLLVRGPGVPVGATVFEMTANVDLAPTLAEIAGVKIPAFVDGRSLMPFLKGQKPLLWRKALLLEHRHPSAINKSTSGLLEPQDPHDIITQTTNSKASGFNSIPPVFVGLRTDNQAIGLNGPITYIEYDTGERELYDLSADPLQLNNKYSTTKPALRSKLRAWLASLAYASGQSIREAEQTSP